MSSTYSWIEPKRIEPGLHVPSNSNATRLRALLSQTRCLSVLFSIALLACASGCSSHHYSLKTGHQYRLFFPDITLAIADGERIESVEVTVSCGRFRALSVIPKDWSANVVSPMSEETTLQASAGHGATTLWSIRELDGAITVSVEEVSCFEITATVRTTTTQHRFTRSDLVLRP